MPVDYSSVRDYRVKYITSQIIHADGTTEKGNNVVGYIVSGPFMYEPEPIVEPETEPSDGLPPLISSDVLRGVFGP